MKLNSKNNYVYLADHPDLLPLLADWFYEEWGHHDPQSSREAMQQQLSYFLNKDRLPLTIVRLKDAQPIASASLKIREMETHPQYLHWLGGVFVLPDFRNKGIGSQVVEFTAVEAIQFDVVDLYLYTRGHQQFYARLGWQEIEKPVYNGRQVSIMKRTLKV